MSQAKVDRNKEQKRNVKKIMAQEKRNWMLTQAVLIAIGAAVIIWIFVAHCSRQSKVLPLIRLPSSLSPIRLTAARLRIISRRWKTHNP